MQTTILGDGHLARAVAGAADGCRIAGRPAGPRHERSTFAGTDLVIDATRGDAVAKNIEAALDGGVRRFVIATTGWGDDRPAVEAALRAAEAAAVVAANFSIGVALFGRLVETASGLFHAIDGFDPFLVEWHRRAKADRPSGTALDLATRIAAGRPSRTHTGDLETVSIRAGSSPGMHLVGFDAAGETVELRLTARDRSAYASGIHAAADWLRRAPRTPGIHGFDAVVDELLLRRGRREAA